MTAPNDILSPSLASSTLPGRGAAAIDPAVLKSIRQASQSTHADFGYLMAQAAQESGFRSNAKAATSSATGLFQFVDSTWLDMVRQHGAKHGIGQLAEQITYDAGGHPHVADPTVRETILALRKDPKISAALAGEFARDNKAEVERARSAGRRRKPTSISRIFSAPAALPRSSRRSSRTVRRQPPTSYPRPHRPIVRCSSTARPASRARWPTSIAASPARSRRMPQPMAGSTVPPPLQRRATAPRRRTVWRSSPAASTSAWRRAAGGVQRDDAGGPQAARRKLSLRPEAERPRRGAIDRRRQEQGPPARLVACQQMAAGRRATVRRSVESVDRDFTAPYCPRRPGSP